MSTRCIETSDPPIFFVFCKNRFYFPYVDLTNERATRSYESGNIIIICYLMRINKTKARLHVSYKTFKLKNAILEIAFWAKPI